MIFFIGFFGTDIKDVNFEWPAFNILVKYLRENTSF